MWLHNGLPMEEAPEGYIGFVYLITELPTDKKYVGKKLFTQTGYYQKNGKRRKKRVPSDWQTYYGSSDNLKKRLEEYGPDQYTREVLHLCETKGELSYYETKEQFTRDVLLREDYYNGIINCRINYKHLPEKMMQQGKD